MDKKLLGKRINIARKERCWTSERLSEANRVRYKSSKSASICAAVRGIESFTNLFVGRSFTQHGTAKYGCAFGVMADCHTKANYNDNFYDSECAGCI